MVKTPLGCVENLLEVWIVKYCPKCNLQYEDKFAFCHHCGSELHKKIEQIFCPYCGKRIETDGEFCPYCGNLLFDTVPVKDIKNAASSTLVEKPVNIHRQENVNKTVLPEVNIKKNYVKMVPLQKSGNTNENQKKTNEFTAKSNNTSQISPRIQSFLETAFLLLLTFFIVFFVIPKMFDLMREFNSLLWVFLAIPIIFTIWFIYQSVISVYYGVKKKEYLATIQPILILVWVIFIIAINVFH